MRLAPFFLVALFVAVGDLSYYQSLRDVSFDHGLAERTLIAARTLWFYAGKLVWPVDLAVVYPSWDIGIGDPLAWGWLVAAVAVAALLWYGRHRLGRGPLAGAAFFAVTLVPVLGFVDFGHMALSPVADRYAYLAGIGVIAVLAGAAAHGADKLPTSAKIGASGVLVAVFAVFGSLAWEQARVYRDRLSFYGHIVSLNPEAPVHGNLARALNDAGRPAEALAASRIAVERRPDSAGAHNIRGLALLSLDRQDEAADSFSRVLELDPGHGHAAYNLAETRMRQGRFEESLRWYRAALDVNPESAAAHSGMGEALFRLGRYAQAARSLEQAVSLRPDSLSISPHHFLAEALRKEERHEEAIDRYRRVLEIDPGFAYAHAGIGYAMFSLQRYDEALDWLGRSVSLEPESPAAADRRSMMGRSYEALGRTEEAADQYGRALEADPRNAGALDALALLRLRQERYEEAIRLYETMIETGSGNAQVHANVGVALYSLDRRDEAVESLDRALSMDPGLAGAGFQELRDALRQGRD